MTVTGGEQPGHWALAPCIEHPVRLSITEAIRRIGPLTASDLREILDDPELQLAHITYHLKALLMEEVLGEIGGRPNRGSIEAHYYLLLRHYLRPWR